MKLSADYIACVVSKLKKTYGSTDPFELCEALDIKVHYMDLDDTMHAYFFYQSRIKNIVINSRAHSILEKVLCAHELGHAMLHNDILQDKILMEIVLYDTKSVTEYEANLFAAELIVSDNDVLELSKNKTITTASIAKELYVPHELLIFKLQMLKSKGYFKDNEFDIHIDFLKHTSLFT